MQKKYNTMKISPIKNEKDYQGALKDLEKVFDAKPGTPQGDQAELLMLIIEDYEKKHHPIDAPDPVEAIKYIMEERQLKNKDVVKYFGSKSLVSQVLNRQRHLSLKIIKSLHKGLGMSYDTLLGETPVTVSEPKARYKKKKK